MPSPFRTALAATAAVALTGGLLTLSAGSAAAAPLAPGRVDADFNHDGYADVAISASHAYVGGKKNAGAVTVLYGGKTSRRTATYTQNSAGVPGAAETDDYFGADTAFGDFNRDGYDDLVVGAPGEDVGSDKDGGTAVILWGSKSGLFGGTTLKDPRPTKHDGYGAPLEAGDFDGDGRDDIAVGTTSGSATIDILRGTFSRTNGAGGPRGYHVTPAVWSGKGNGVHNLHSGDLNGDGREDLIVNGYAGDEGLNANYWLPGSASGATTKGAQKLPAGIITDIGKTDKDKYADLVIGVEWDSGIGHAHKGGTALIVHGTKNGPASGTIQTFTQDTAGVPGGGEKKDCFGSELDLGDINGDGHLDLLVGSPGETLNGHTATGAVTVLFNKADGSGITGTGSLMLSQDSPGVPGGDEAWDNFGSEVHIDDLNGDKKGDLIIAAPWENGDGAVTPLLTQANGRSFKGTTALGVSTVGISTAGNPVFGINMAD